MTLKIKKSYINLFDNETLLKKFSMENTLNQVNFKGDQPVKFNQNVILTHVSGNFDNVAQKLHDVDAAAATLDKTHVDLVTVVSDSLTVKVAEVNHAIGTISSALNTAIASSATAQAADATARDVATALVVTNINDEKVRALAAEKVNADAIVAKVNTSSSRLASVTAARTVAINSIQSQIDLVKNNSDTASVDSINDLLTKMAGDDADIQEIVTAVQTQLATLQSTIDMLTDDQDPSKIEFTSVNVMGNANKLQLQQIDDETELNRRANNPTKVNQYIHDGIVYLDPNLDGNAEYWVSQVLFKQPYFPSLVM
jgi:hypothetical protein